MASQEATSQLPSGTARANAAQPIPSPGEIFDPVARALEVIGDRWSLVLIRQLLAGPKGFQDLRVRTGIAPRVLSGRLRQLAADGFVESVSEGTRSVYGATRRGRSLEPIVSSIARWWVTHGIDDLSVDLGQYTATSAQSVIEVLPLLLRDDRAVGADVTFEIRLTGEGGGVWTVAIEDGACHVAKDFADRADVRYTADARTWTMVALGLRDAREAVKEGLMNKDGSHHAMDHYFHQLSRRGAASLESAADEGGHAESGQRPGDDHPTPRRETEEAT